MMSEPQDLVLMRRVHAGFVPVKPARDTSPVDRDPSPHYSSPLPGTGAPRIEEEIEQGPRNDQRSGDGPGLRSGQGPGPDVLQNLLRTEPETSASADPGLVSSGGPSDQGPFSLWPPALLDQALRLGLLDPPPRLIVAGSPSPSGPWEPPSLSHVGASEEAGLCSCHGPAPWRLRPPQQCHEEDAHSSHEAPRPLSRSLDRLLDRLSDRLSDRRPEQVLAQVLERGCKSTPHSRASTPKLSVASGGRCLSPVGVQDKEKHSTRGKSRSSKVPLKTRLSKLFRTRSGPGPGRGLGPGLGDKRPSVSSTSSGGSLLDLWGSNSSNQDQNQSRLQRSRPLSAFSPVTFTPLAFTGETVSLLDVDVSRSNRTLHPPTPPPPPRRSLSLLDGFGAPPSQSSFLDDGVGVSVQSLPPAVGSLQHSLSLSDAFLRTLPRPVPLRPPPRPATRCRLSQSYTAAHCLLSQSDTNSFASSLRELEKCGWYWGPMTWLDAEAKLRDKADGSFLVRDSSDPRYILSLSFRSQGLTHHTRMEHYRGTFSLWTQSKQRGQPELPEAPELPDRCESVVDFIHRAITHSKHGQCLYFLRSRVPGLPPTPVQLLFPVSRFSSVKTLQHLCRFCIRQAVRIDHVEDLPLPGPLISYLRKFYYYDAEEQQQPGT
ncbi:unnamed protein product [Knipowitschia caucasica]